MAKTKEELNENKKEYEKIINKLHELNEDELKQITGGADSIDVETYTNWEILPSMLSKTKELLDEELDKVTGGYVQDGDNYYFEGNEVFKNNRMLYVINKKQTLKGNEGLQYDVYRTLGPNAEYVESDSYAVSYFVNSYTYIGTKDNCGYNF